MEMENDGKMTEILNQKMKSEKKIEKKKIEEKKLKGGKKGKSVRKYYFQEIFLNMFLM